jgi:hypothetical protein
MLPLLRKFLGFFSVTADDSIHVRCDTASLPKFFIHQQMHFLENSKIYVKTYMKNFSYVF